MQATTKTGSVGPRVERRSIDFVPENERHGSPAQQFTLWFGANMQITAIVDGALAVLFGADALWAIIGLLIGNLLGGAVMALHAAQGPKLGLPQMISSRAQFGILGAVIPLVLVIIMYLGFAATGTVLAGQAVDEILHTGTPAVGMVIFGALTILVATLGYKYIHMMGRIATIVGVLGFTYNTKNTATQYQSGVDMHFDWGASQFLSKQVMVGLVGYVYKQLGCDSGPGDRVGCFQSQVVGVGPQIGFLFPVGDMQGYLNLKAYGEFAAENRPSGWNAWVTFAISPPAPGAPPTTKPIVRKY